MHLGELFSPSLIPNLLDLIPYGKIIPHVKRGHYTMPSASIPKTDQGGDIVIFCQSKKECCRGWTHLHYPGLTFACLYFPQKYLDFYSSPGFFFRQNSTPRFDTYENWSPPVYCGSLFHAYLVAMRNTAAEAQMEETVEFSSVWRCVSKHLGLLLLLPCVITVYDIVSRMECLIYLGSVLWLPKHEYEMQLCFWW